MKKRNRIISFFPVLIFGGLYLVALCVSIICCEQVDVEKMWAIFANITVVFGGIGLLYSFLQINQGERTLTKETLLLEIELGDELNRICENLRSKSRNPSGEHFGGGNKEELRAVLQYFSKLNLLQKNRVVDGKELCRMYGMNLKYLFLTVVKFANLNQKEQEEIEQVLKNYRQDILDIFEMLCDFDKDVELLEEKVTQMTQMKQKNYLTKNLI